MDVRIPNLGEGAESGSVVNIHVKVGDKVKKDQTLIELENEKAVAPIPSTQAGTVTKIYVKTGDKVSVGAPIVQIAEEGVAASQAPAENKPQAAAPASPQYAQPVSAAPSSAQPGEYQYTSKSGFAPPASPTVRKIAQDLGLDLTRIKGSEAGGRIVVADLKNYIAWLQSAAQAGSRGGASVVESRSAAPAESIDFSKWGKVTRKPLTSLRQKIAQKMSESWTTIPHVTQFEEADITALTELRKKFAPLYEKKGAKLTLTSFIIKASVTALAKFPSFRSSLDERAQELVLKDYYHIGIAVDTEQGLIVPVLKDADKKSLFEISKDLEVLAEKTRTRKVSADDLRGGTFTISNLGGIGGTFFTPIINKPEVAILGVGRGVLKPVVIPAKGKAKDKIETRLLLPLGLSYDHRVIDGADGARFIRALAVSLENFKAEDVKL